MIVENKIRIIFTQDDEDIFNIHGEANNRHQHPNLVLVLSYNFTKYEENIYCISQKRQ